MSKQASKLDDVHDDLHGAVYQVLIDYQLSGVTAMIAADAAVHALSGRAMSARDVFERMRLFCCVHDVCDGRCDYKIPSGGPCDMAHCPRLR